MSFSGPSDRGPISAVREGMQVVDARGDKVGKVDVAHMGDPEAVTDRGQPAVDPQGLLEAVFFPAGDQLPDQVRKQLGRTGFVRIDRSGIFSGSCYAGPDDIARVEGDTVHLTKEQGSLITLS